MPAVLFVCLGNICRSPAGEGILKDLAVRNGIRDLHVESCGIGGWHVGQLPDERMRAAAKRRGFNLTSKAQKFREEFFNNFDLILAVDAYIMEELHSLAPNKEMKDKIFLVNDFGTTFQGEGIPDPYYGSGGSFETVLDMLEEACIGILNNLFKEEKKDS